MLDVAHLVKDYPAPQGTLRVLDDVTFSLQPGDAAAITGPSGSGKSTLLYVLGGLEPPTAGHVHLDGRDPYTFDSAALAEFRNRQVGFVFQDHCLLPQLTVLENVLLPTLVSPSDNGTSPLDDARELVRAVGLEPRIDHRPASLSGGERQWVAIARALIRRPTLLLCDEPTGNLDADTAGIVTALLLELHRRRQTILVVVTHSEPVASALPIRLRLDRGRVTR